MTIPSPIRCLLLCTALAGCQTSFPRVAQPVYPSPGPAFDRLLDAMREDNIPAAEIILGLRLDEILSGDLVSDKMDKKNFLKLAGQQTHVRKVTDTTAWLDCGSERWTFPVPVVKDGDTWHFDGNWGREEIRNRIAGRNELATMDTLRDLARAQTAYHAMDPDGDGIKAYAARIISQPGQRDGLYWPEAAGAPVSPVGRLAAQAEAEGYRNLESRVVPFHGYHFRVLHAQGKNAPGGKRAYTDADGRLTGGFALLAWPAEYGRSGLMTFLVDGSGRIFEKDLGKATSRRAPRMTDFNPDASWSPSGDFP